MIQAIHENKLDADGHYISFSREITIAHKFAQKSEATLEIWMNDSERNHVLSDDPSDSEMAEHFPLAYAEHHYVGSWTSGGAVMVFDQEKIRTRFHMKSYTDSPGEKWEMEERIFRDLMPLRDYITEIKLVRNAAFGAIAMAVLNGNEELGITPHPEYRDAIQFIRGKIA